MDMEQMDMQFVGDERENSQHPETIFSDSFSVPPYTVYQSLILFKHSLKLYAYNEKGPCCKYKHSNRKLNHYGFFCDVLDVCNEDILISKPGWGNLQHLDYNPNLKWNTFILLVQFFLFLFIAIIYKIKYIKYSSSIPNVIILSSNPQIRILRSMG